MKIHYSLVSGVLAATQASAATIKETNYLNHEMLNYKPKTGSHLFSGRPEWRHDASIVGEGGSKRALRNTVSRNKQEEGGPFYEAETLKYFRDGIDSDLFEFINPDEIEAGKKTCGFLKPNLGSLSGVTYPVIDVYVCAQFATTQPSPKGNLFHHPGGPGAMSGDTIDHWIPEGVDASVFDMYNVWTIDQRGGGRSKPSTTNEACGSMPDASDPESYSDAEAMKATLAPYRERALACWALPEYQLTATQEDGSNKTFHFLEFMGTRELAEDMERLRIIINAPKWHLNGQSYGTTVMATYATLFPDTVGLFYIDGNESPNQGHRYQAYTAGIAQQERITRLVFDCTANNLVKPGSCPVEDLGQCLSSLQKTLGMGLSMRPTFQKFLQILFDHQNKAEEICSAAAAGDKDGLMAIKGEFEPPQVATTKQSNEVDCSKDSTPTPNFYVPNMSVCGVPNYAELWGGLFYQVKFADHSQPIYDDDQLAQEVVEFNKLYTGAGSSGPAEMFFSNYIYGYYVPKSNPLPVLGNPSITGIIAGGLYDHATPYLWTQEMKERFPGTALLTAQVYNHPPTSTDPVCAPLKIEYFETGVVPFNDGHICRKPFLAADAIITNNQDNPMMNPDLDG